MGAPSAFSIAFRSNTSCRRPGFLGSTSILYSNHRVMLMGQDFSEVKAFRLSPITPERSEVSSKGSTNLVAGLLPSVLSASRYCKLIVFASTPLATSKILDSAREKPDRKSTRLNSSHGYISYAVFCLKKKKRNCRSVPNIGTMRAASLRAPARTIQRSFDQTD